MQDGPHEDAQASVFRVEIAGNLRPQISGVKISLDRVLHQHDQAGKTESEMNQTLQNGDGVQLERIRLGRPLPDDQPQKTHEMSARDVEKRRYHETNGPQTIERRANERKTVGGKGGDEEVDKTTDRRRDFVAEKEKRDDGRSADGEVDERCRPAPNPGFVEAIRVEQVGKVFDDTEFPEEIFGEDDWKSRGQLREAKEDHESQRRQPTRSHFEIATVED